MKTPVTNGRCPLTNDPHRTQHCSAHQIAISLLWNIWQSSMSQEWDPQMLKTLWISKARVSRLLTQKSRGISYTFQTLWHFQAFWTFHTYSILHPPAILRKLHIVGGLSCTSWETCLHSCLLSMWQFSLNSDYLVTLENWSSPPFRCTPGNSHVVIIARQLSWHNPSPLARLPWESSFPWIGDAWRNLDWNCDQFVSLTKFWTCCTPQGPESTHLCICNKRGTRWRGHDHWPLTN